MPLHISKLDCKFVRVRVRVLVRVLLLLLLLLRKWRKSTNESLQRRSRCFKEPSAADPAGRSRGGAGS